MTKTTTVGQLSDAFRHRQCMLLINITAQISEDKNDS